jgi:hypothetical protein
MQPHSQKIIHHLERVTASGASEYNIFDDWLLMVAACLEAMPRHAEHAVKNIPFEDTPETADLFARMHARYPDYCWEYFADAFAELVLSTDEWRDTIGEVYMTWNISNSYTGQYFTPLSVAEAMAEMTMQGIESLLHERIKEAIYGDPIAEAILITSLITEGEEAQKLFYHQLLPAVAPRVKPINIHDPCCGSGVMFLAAASKCPRWALDYGLIQFYGCDIDFTCVTMAKVNCMLYGLNGYAIKCALALSGAELKSIPEPITSAYAEAQQAGAAGDQQRVIEISQELRSGTYKQKSLFDAMELVTQDDR